MKYVQLIAAVCIFFATEVNAQKSSLPHSTPEAEGVSSKGIISFLDAANKSTNEFHSFMMLRHGKVIAEGWWDPYSADMFHTLYSTSKSFTATAVGFAISEHKLNLDDKVISFFPDQLPDTVSDYLKALTVKDVLIMSDGQEPDPTGVVVTGSTNWIKSFFATPILHKPGSVFLYNSLGTYMLSAIVQKVTGQTELDYLKPRLFEPLGIKEMDWETNTMGINTGGWGLRLKTEDMAKFGQLFLQKGMWNGKQVLPAGWVEEASSAKIIQHPDYSQAKRDSSDWEQGYCYQMWRCRHNGYRADGAFGQYIIVLPDKDAVIAITCETPSMQNEINLVWDYLLPAMNDAALPADKTSDDELSKKLAALALPIPAKTTSALETSLNNKTFSLDKNDAHLQKISFSFKNQSCRVTLDTDTTSYIISFGSGKWIETKTDRRGPNLLYYAHENFTPLSPYKIAAAYSWTDDNTLQLTLRYIESPHTDKIVCHFDNGKITIGEENSYDYGKKKVEMKGVMEKIVF